MKCTIPEISWHNRDPVLSIDVQPSKNGTVVPPYRLATGGTDSHVVIWYVTIKERGLASVEVAADLQRHQRAVNTVRFSPSGQFLASGDDESVIIVWKPKTEHDISDLANTDGEVSKEQWVSMKTLRGHLEDVYDISWSLDSVHLVSGSIDNTAIIWDVQKGRSLGLLTGHSGFVQGVAWDPKNKYAATLSSDRTCRIHNISTKKLTSKVGKAPLPVPPGSDLSGKVMHLFHDDTLKSFFRRLSFSPDGELLVTPSGVIEIPNTEKHISATYIFSRYDFSRPVLYLPSPDEYTIAVRFCPLLFKLHEGNSLFALPYRMVFAVATKNNVILYDTQQPEPIALISNIHYTRLTDLSWSSDARVLIASSTDGYCSIITFSEGELGDVYEHSSVNTENENEIQNTENKQSESSEFSTQAKQSLSAPNSSICSVKVKEIVPEINKTVSKSSNTSTTDKSICLDGEEPKHTSHLTVIKDKSPCTPAKDKKSPRRITLITLSSPRKRVTHTCESDLKMTTCESMPSKETTALPGNKNDPNMIEKHLCPSRNSGDETCLKKINSSNAEGKPIIEDECEPMQTDDSNKVVKEITSHETGMESMEIETTSSAVSFTDKKIGSPDKSLSGVTTNNSKEAKFNNPITEETQMKENGELRKTNSHTSNADENEVNDKSEECKKSLPKKDLNDHETEFENKIIKSCEKSPLKAAVVNSCETTPSKHLSDKIQTELEHTCTPSRLSDETSQREVSCNVTPVEKRTPRRVQFITISSPKSKKKLM